MSGARFGPTTAQSTQEARATGDGDAILAMEPELRALSGVVAVLKVFAEARDPIDPSALALLALGARQATERLTTIWRELAERPPP